MIRKLTELFRAADLRVLVGVALVAYGASMLQTLAGDRQDELAQLDEQIADRQLTLAAVDARLARAREKEDAAGYPTQVDVDPLHRSGEEEPAPAAVPISHPV